MKKSLLIFVSLLGYTISLFSSNDSIVTFSGSDIKSDPLKYIQEVAQLHPLAKDFNVCFNESFDDIDDCLWHEEGIVEFKGVSTSMIKGIVSHLSMIDMPTPHNSNIKITVPLKCAHMMIVTTLYHELGHLYYNHYAQQDRVKGREQEVEADEFATYSLESIIGGIIFYLIQEAQLTAACYNVWGAVPHSTQNFYYRIYNKERGNETSHPSFYERLQFFKSALKKYLRNNPSSYKEYEILKKEVEKIKMCAYGENYTFTL